MSSTAVLANASEDSHMAAAAALCEMPESPMPKKRSNGNAPSPIGSSPFSLFTASLSPIIDFKANQSRDGAGSLANSPCQPHLVGGGPGLHAKLSPSMYTLEADSNSLSGLMSLSSPSPFLNTASNCSYVSFSSISSFKGRTPSYVQKLEFGDEDNSLPFGTSQNSNMSTTPGGRSRLRICNGRISKTKITGLNLNDEHSQQMMASGASNLSPPSTSSNIPSQLRQYMQQHSATAHNSSGPDAAADTAGGRPSQDPKFVVQTKATTIGNLKYANSSATTTTSSNGTATSSHLNHQPHTQNTVDGSISPTPPRTKQLQQQAPPGTNSLKVNGGPFSTPAAQRSGLRGRQRINSVMTPETVARKRNPCNCKKSRCLKLYCECFAAGVYCDGCNCTNCANNKECEAQRAEAIKATLDRNPNAFQPKIKKSGPSPAGQRSLAGVHSKGCHCKKSGCLKKYCECFQASVYCGQNCKCQNCKNYEGSTAIQHKSRAGKRARDAATGQEFATASRSIYDSGGRFTNAKKQRVHTNPPPASGLPPVATTAGTRPPLSHQPLMQGRGLASSSNLRTANDGLPPSAPVAQGKQVPSSTTNISALRNRASDTENTNVNGITAMTASTNGKVLTSPDPHALESSSAANKDAATAEEDVDAFGMENPKLDRRLVVSILTYLDNADLYNSSLVSKTLGPIAVSDSLWEFPQEMENKSSS